MFNFSVFSAFIKASWLVKGVMLLLLFMSIFSWAIIIYHFFYLRRENGQIKAIKEKIKGKDLYKYFLILKNRSGVKRGIDALIFAGYGEILDFKVPNQDVLLNAERKMRCVLDQEQMLLDRHVNILATIGSIAPYIGLLGTVYGVMHAFHLLGNLNNQASIGLIAPGIAEALITTALGLLVAIPATAAFNIISSKIDSIVEIYRLYYSELDIYFRHEFLNYHLSQRKNEA